MPQLLFILVVVKFEMQPPHLCLHMLEYESYMTNCSVQHNVSKGLMCLSTSGSYTQVEIPTCVYTYPQHIPPTYTYPQYTYPQPVPRHYHPKYTLIMLAPVSYLRSLVVRAVHRHHTGV